MPPQDFGARQFGLAKPGKGVAGLMIALGAIWLMFAVALNWAGASADVFYAVCGNTERIVHGQVWRLFTAPWLHIPSGSIGHIVWAILGLFFFAPALEEKWGTARFLRFYFFSSVIAYTFQLLCEVAVPSFAQRLVPDYWFGSVPALEACAIAWALTFRGQTIRLWFIVPMTSTGLVILIAAVSVLRIIAVDGAPEGLLSPIGGMFAGWLIGGGTPSPLRRAYLKLRLAQLDREAARGSRARAERRAASQFRVLEGGKGRGAGEKGREREGHDDDSNGKLLH